MATPLTELEIDILRQLAQGSLRSKIVVEQAEVRSSNYIQGSQGWKLKADGAEANNLTIKKVAGAPTGGVSGDIALDTTNSRFYVKVGSTWKYAALT